MNNPRLQQCCQEAQAKVQALNQQLSGIPGAIPAALENQLKMIQERTRQAEVRILVLGPLKSGKSTFMNVFTGNPLVSQVTPLPAYPCAVEITDLAAASADGATPDQSVEVSIFCCGAAAEPPIPLEQGLQKLEQLLGEYAFQGSEEKIQYDRVIQRVRLNGAHGQVGLVLIDSPGLLFGGQRYSQKTIEMLDGADAVVFVIRPEQLFFAAVQEYLEALVTHAVYRRVFILVNCSSQATNLRQGTPEPCDQTALAEEFRRYFNRHIADERLLAALQKGTQFTMHFTDLLQAGRARFNGSAHLEAAPKEPTPALAAMEDLKLFIEGSDLVAVKKRNLSHLLGAAVKAGREHLQDLQKETMAEVKTAQGQIVALEEELRRIMLAQQSEEQTQQAALGAVAQWERQLDLLGREPLGEVGKACSTDPLLGKLGLIESALEQARFESAMDVNSLKPIVEKIYGEWKDGQVGSKTLKNLAWAVWSKQVVDSTPALGAKCGQVLHEAYNACLSAVRGLFADGSEWQQILARNEFARPIRAADWPGAPLALLPFPKVRGIWHLIGYTPEDLFGGEGNKKIEGSFEEDILKCKQRELVAGILHDPWHLLKCFSEEAMKEVAGKELLGRLTTALKDCQQGKLVEKHAEIQHCVDQAAVFAAQRAQVEFHLQEQMTRLQHLQATGQDLENRTHGLDQLLADL